MGLKDVTGFTSLISSGGKFYCAPVSLVLPYCGHADKYKLTKRFLDDSRFILIRKNFVQIEFWRSDFLISACWLQILLNTKSV